ncbi:MAG: hypothetical protein FJ010_08200 [Chloroflexi bacterium]|nr:hypothetical protein [Chloroflexota bacterium]
MNVKKFYFVLLIAGALLLVSTTTAFARPILAEFTIDNKSPYTAYIYMYGPGDEYYYLTVSAGTSKTFTVDRVAYTYELLTCNGVSSEDAIDLTNSGKLVIPATCEMPAPVDQVLFSRPELAEFRVDNQSDEAAYLYMYGAGGEYYYLTVPAATSKTFTVERELYSYDLVTCNGDLSTDNAIDLTNSGSLTLTGTCVVLVPITFVNFSEEGETLFFTMTGPQTVSFNLEADEFRSFTVLSGLYDFSYSGCANGVVDGTLLTVYNSWYWLTCPE